MKHILWRIIKIVLIALLVLIIGFTLYVLTKSPSNDRVWNTDQAILPHATVTGDSVAIENIRNFSYVTTATYTPAYYNKTFNLNDLIGVDYIVEPLGTQGVAHTFLSFRFKNDEYLSISVEIRKEKGEFFSPWKGMVRSYELMYVIADERDVVKLRSNYRKDPVFIYPLDFTEAEVRTLFVDMLSRANTLAEKPEFYHSLWNACMTNIRRHVHTIRPDTIPVDMRLILPRDSDLLFYELGLIKTTVPQEKLRETYQINTLAEKYANDPLFSKRIRAAH